MTPPSPLRLTILASLGILQACSTAAVGPDAGADPVIAQAADLASSTDWRRCLDLWAVAAEAAFGDDPYPFDDQGKAEMLGFLDETEATVRALQQHGLISGAEAGLLGQDIATLRAGVQAKRTREWVTATCYEPMAIQPRRDALASLASRVTMLERLAAQDTLRPEVLTRVLEQVRTNLATLTQDDGMQLTPDEQQQAVEVEGRIRAALATIEGRLHGGEPSPVAPPPADPGTTIPEVTAEE